MKKQFVSSSSIEALGYNAKDLRLRVWFLTGSIYDYHPVPYKEYKAFLNASSIGTHFNNHIKGIYAFNKIG